MNNPQLNGLPLSEELLEFYRQRLIKYEGELQSAIDKIESVKASHNQYYEAVRDLHQKNTELDEVKKALSEAQTGIFEERKHLLRVISENDELKIREIQDRKKIQYLLSIGTTMHEETTYFRDKIPKKVVKGVSQQQEAAEEEKDTVEEKHAHALSEREAEIEIQTLKLRTAALQTQLTEQAKTYDGLIKQLHNEKAVRVHDLERQGDRLKAQVESLMTENNKLRQISRENIKELLQVKKEFKMKERQLMEEKTAYFEDKKILAKKMADLEQEFREVEKNVETKYLRTQESKMQEMKDKYARALEENRKLKNDLDRIDLLFKKKNQQMEKKIDTLTTSYMNLKKRRHFEIEGFTNDILILRKQLKQLEKTLLRFAPLQDKEFAILALASKTASHAEHISSSLAQLKNSIQRSETAAEKLHF